MANDTQATSELSRLPSCVFARRLCGCYSEIELCFRSYGWRSRYPGHRCSIAGRSEVVAVDWSRETSFYGGDRVVNDTCMKRIPLTTSSRGIKPFSFPLHVANTYQPLILLPITKSVAFLTSEHLLLLPLAFLLRGMCMINRRWISPVYLLGIRRTASDIFGLRIPCSNVRHSQPFSLLPPLLFGHCALGSVGVDAAFREVVCTAASKTQDAPAKGHGAACVHCQEWGFRLTL